jgi:cold shock CspA family protein
MTPIKEGKVKAVSARADYGFIRSSGTDFFFHRSDCDSAFHELTEGTAVTFEAVEPSPARGPRATHVALAAGED